MSKEEYLKAFIAFNVISAIFVLIYIHNDSKNNNTNKYETDSIGVTVHFPSTWIEGNEKYTNSDGTCSVVADSSRRDIERIKEEMIPYQINYSLKKKDKVDMYYGYTETEDKKVYAYIFAHPNVEEKRYLIYTQDINTETEDCMEFINQIDTRIVVNY